MYGHSSIGDLILYMDNWLIGIFIFIERIGLKDYYIYTKTAIFFCLHIGSNFKSLHSQPLNYHCHFLQEKNNT
jgi:hypothetical protein